MAGGKTESTPPGQEAQDLEKEIREGGMEKANLLAKLLALLKRGGDSEESDLAALHSARRCFTTVLERGDLVVLYDEQPDSALSKYAKWVETKYIDFLKHLLSWVDSQQAVYQVAALRTIMHFVKLDGHRLMKGASRFGLGLFSMLIATVAKSSYTGDMNGQVLRVLSEEYFDSYVDCCLYALWALQQVCRVKLEQSSDNESDEENDNSNRSILDSTPDSWILDHVWKSDTDLIMENLFNLLYLIPAVPEAERLKDNTAWWVAPTKAKELPSVLDSKLVTKEKGLKQYKKAFQSAWVTFLNVKDRPVQIYRKVLLALPSRVMPFFTNPLLLSDFLMDAYEVGGLNAIMALQSLFKLITEHGLDCPEFYEKLYALITLESFHAKHRAQFFALLDKVLSSTHLATYLVAAFAKRILRLALFAPPGSAMFSLVLVSNLLKRHPTCLSLVHQVKDQSEGEYTTLEEEVHSNDKSEGSDEDGDDDGNDKAKENTDKEDNSVTRAKAQEDTIPMTTAEREKQQKLERIKKASLALALGLNKKRKRSDSELDGDENTTADRLQETQQEEEYDDDDEDEAGKALTQDPFDISVQDPSACAATESCLWELETIGKHYNYNVSLLVESLYNKELKTTIETKKVMPPVSVEEFITVTYKSLFDRELKKTQKKRRKTGSVPVTFTNRYDLGSTAAAESATSVFRFF